MFQFPSFPSSHYEFMWWSYVLHISGSPIRKSADRSLFAAPRSLSQLVTSFVGSWCQGIHLVLFLAWTSLFCFLCLSFANNLFYNEKAFSQTFVCSFVLSFWFSACFFNMRPNCSFSTIFRKTFNYFLISIFSFNPVNYLFVFSYLVFNEHSSLFQLCDLRFSPILT